MPSSCGPPSGHIKSVIAINASLAVFFDRSAIKRYCSTAFAPPEAKAPATLSNLAELLLAAPILCVAFELPPNECLI